MRIVVVAVCLATVLLAQASPPDEYPGWVKSLAYFGGGIALFLVIVNQGIVLWEKIRGKQAVAYGQTLITQEALQNVVQPVTDHLTAHEQRDSDRFDAIDKGLREIQRELQQDMNVMKVRLERLVTTLENKGRWVGKREEHDPG